ncbi:helix-turn-helix domain-containing protein [Streptomyces sp. NPDC097941]|uniref:helix-turn-helix domain-containing protein n=1 Tax=Streptomyces sp. NPDC097941 TaxID=3155685 RepID=UPI00332359F8
MTPPSPERARLAATLRELRARTGLSMAALAGKTSFSKSSWERYLNGRTLPPRPAVQELCRLTGEPDGRCLALWEIAESEWSGRAAHVAHVADTGTPTRQPSPVPEPDHGPDPPPAAQEVARARHKGVAAVAVLASVCAVVVGGVTVALFPLPRQDADARSSAGPSPSATGPRCRGADCEEKNPIRMVCAAAPDSLASHRTTTGAWLELRHSEECGTSWARMWGTRIGDRIELTVADHSGRIHDAEVENGVDAESYVYTPMAVTRPGTVVRACFRPAAGGKKECFDGRVGQGPQTRTKGIGAPGRAHVTPAPPRTP